MTKLPELFPGFSDTFVDGDGATLHVRIGGDGPPLVLLHGYPQCGVMWHRIAPALAGHFTVIVPDLRGYGQSSVPASNGGEGYSKRAMGNDIAAMMTRLGHQKFALAGHDRGGRVAYRMAFDHPERLTKVAVLDILPTWDYWTQMDWTSGLRMYHWLFLAQPEPMPETLIGGAKQLYLEHTLAAWTEAKTLAAFDERALAHYRAFFDDPARIHACCEDYRAGATIDMALDAADREAGRTIETPLLAIWGARGLSPQGGAPLDIWRTWAPDAQGVGVGAGHFIAEENPDGTLAALMDFLP